MADPGDHGEHDRLLPQRRRLELEDGDEDLVEEDAELLLVVQVINEMNVSRHKKAHLQHPPQPLNHLPKNLDAELEYRGHGARHVPAQRQAQVLRRHVDEPLGALGGRVRVRVHDRGGGDEDVHVGFEDQEDHV